MKPRIKSMLYNIRKQKTTKQNKKKKKESKKKIVQATSGATSSVPTFASWGCQEKEKNKKLEI